MDSADELRPCTSRPPGIRRRLRVAGWRVRRETRTSRPILTCGSRSYSAGHLHFTGAVAKHAAGVTRNDPRRTRSFENGAFTLAAIWRTAAPVHLDGKTP